MKWTTEQQKVIDLRDRDILVSAAAGSGKTAVLVERIIQRITDKKHPVDIDRLFVVTFTKAAAAEMRERIGAAIEAQCEQYPEDMHLRRQSALLHNAMITTIDSFCLFVVRNHFEEINLDPNFRIADEGEMKLLEQDVMQEVFEGQYANQAESFLHLIDAYANKRSDQAVRDMVSKIYHMSLSSPWPLEWMEGLVAPYQVKNKEELQQTQMIQEIVTHVRQLVSDMKMQLEHLMHLALAEDGPSAYATTIEQDIKLLEEVDDCADYEQMQNFFTGLKFGNLSAIRKFTGDPIKKETVQTTRNAIKKEMETIKTKYFGMDLDRLLEQVTRLEPIAGELVELSLLYAKAMAAGKSKKRIVDFSDIEHFALQILVDDKTKKCRHTAEEFRRHFEEIMIDEYQDSNQVQEEIMTAISRHEEGGHNMFMVGDVKQSIYRFRLARPELFMGKYALFSTEEARQQRIDLHQNFRSRQEVVDFCNDIFYKIMSPDLGRVTYDEDAALYCGASYPDNANMQAELLLLDEADDMLKEQKNLDKKQMEAHMAAAKIQWLMKHQKVVDKASGELRPMRYGDIVILFRSLKNWGTDFVSVLGEHGIPAHVESSTGYFSALEVQTILSYLRILDNPYQDIPMAAVLKSPIVGLDEEELAQLRVSDPTVPFAAAALKQMEEATEGPLAKFYENYSSLRKERDLPIHELIQKILAVTGYGNYAQAMPAGDRRGANLQMLIEKAVDYEKTSYRGLFHFVRYIDQLQKYEIDYGEADTTGENADVVRIMTIHKSKGLEFPVVFVSGMAKHFNQMDTNDKLVVHPDLGMGICEISGKPKIKKNCLFRSVIADNLRRENLGEELRVLYVALTRAKEKLILTGVIKDGEKTIGKYTGNTIPKKPIGYRERVGAVSYLDWVLPAMLSYPDKYTITWTDPKEIVWETVKEAAEKQMDYQELMAHIQNANLRDVQKYAELFSYEYPYKSQAGRKSKYSVSELKHASMVLQYDQTEGEAQVPEFLLEEHESYVPDFAREGEQKETTVSPVNPGALRGTAVHRVMECLDFTALAKINQTDSKAVQQFVAEQLEQMKASGELMEEYYNLIVPATIEGFVKSPVAMRMAKAACKGELYREKPFVMQHEDVLVQGIIDVFWMEEDNIILLDYKTDRIKKGEELVMRYETQLRLYADALSRVFSNETVHKKAEECLLYSFHLQEVVCI